MAKDWLDTLKSKEKNDGFTCKSASKMFDVFISELKLHGVDYWSGREYEQLKMRIYYDTVSTIEDEKEMDKFVNDGWVSLMMEGVLP